MYISLKMHGQVCYHSTYTAVLDELIPSASMSGFSLEMCSFCAASLIIV